MNQISKKYLWIYSNRFIPLYYIRRNTKKNLVKIRADLGVPQARRKISWKYKRNGHIFGDKFVLVTTFYHVHIFRNRFGCWSAFLLFFEKTPMKTIFTAISRWAITAIMAIYHFMAIMAHIVMAIHMVFMGVSSKDSKNADQHSKWFLKIWKW